MIKEIILIFFMTFGVNNSDVKILDLPKISNNFGASIKDYYKNNYKGNYTYIFANDDGSKQRQDGIDGEKRGYYTFVAPLPDGRTYTVCYYTKNGYHAKTTIIEVEDVEAFCDMIIEQSGNIKFQQSDVNKQVNKQSEKNRIKNVLSDPANNSEKLKNTKLNNSIRKEQNQNRTPSSKIDAKIATVTERLTSNNKIGKIKSTVIQRKLISANSETSLKTKLKTKTLNSNSIESKPISSPITNSKKFSSNKTSLTLTNTDSEKGNNNEVDNFNVISEKPSLIPQLTALDIDLPPLPGLPKFEIPAAKTFKQNNTNFKTSDEISDETNEEEENPDIDIRFSNSGLSLPPTAQPNKTKIDELIKGIFKYGLKKGSLNETFNSSEILPPAKIFLPPFIDEEVDLLRPSIELIPPAPSNNVASTIFDTTFAEGNKLVVAKRTRKRTIDSPTLKPISQREENKFKPNQSTATTTRKSLLTTTTQSSKTTPKTFRDYQQSTTQLTFTTLLNTTPKFTTITTSIPITSNSKKTSTKKFVSGSRIGIFNTKQISESVSNKPFTFLSTKQTTSTFEYTKTIPTKPNTTTTNKKSTYAISTRPDNMISNNNISISKPSLDLIPPFSTSNIDLLPPINDGTANLLPDKSKAFSSNIVSRSIQNKSQDKIECQFGILRTNSEKESSFINPKTTEEIEAINNIFKTYKYPQSEDEFNALKDLNMTFSCLASSD